MLYVTMPVNCTLGFIIIIAKKIIIILQTTSFNASQWQYSVGTPLPFWQAPAPDCNFILQLWLLFIVTK